MYTILIVDDEWLVREGLKQTIPWEEIGCRLIGEAANGQAGWQMIERLKPDILLTDIRMPGCDGLELARRAGEAYPHTKIVFLTGFDEFAYAQQAIKLGAADFVLKPTDPDELMRTIGRVIRQIEAEREHQEYAKRLELKIESSQPLLLAKLLHDFMLDSATEREAELLKELLGDRVNEVFASFQVAIVEWEPDSTQEDRLPWTAALEPLMQALDGWSPVAGSSGAASIVSDAGYCTETGSLRLFMHEHRLAVLLACPSAGWREQAAGLIAACRDQGWSVSVGISGTHRHYHSLAAAYHEAEVALQQKEYIGYNRIICYEELDQLIVKEKYGLDTIEQYIREHYDKDISLQDVAASVHMSESYFSRIFKKYSGVSFIEYVTQLRLEKAKQLLLRPDAKIYEVSLAVGYQDARYFSQLFRKWTGETPTEFRRRMGLH